MLEISTKGIKTCVAEPESEAGGAVIKLPLPPGAGTVTTNYSYGSGRVYTFRILNFLKVHKHEIILNFFLT